MNSTSLDQLTIIVGGGITGLTASSILAQAGEKCLLLEADDNIGGLCRTYMLDNITFDLGPHLLFLNKDFKSDRFILDLLKDEQVVNNRFHFAIHGQGRSWKMPLDILDILFFYPWKYKREMVQALLNKGKPIHGNRNSVQSMVEEKAGRSYYIDLYKPLMFKKIGISGHKLHRDWSLRVDRDIKNRKEIFSGVEHTIKLRHKIQTILNSRYYYPLNGFETIAQKLWERYRQAGGETILECGSIYFEKTNKRILEVIADGNKYPVKNVIWTASINALNSLLGVDIKPINYTDLIIVLLTYNRARRIPRRFAYTYHIANNLIFNRLYYPENIFRQKNPFDHEGICAEILGSSDFQNASDIDIIDRVVIDIEKLGLYRKTELRQYRLFRLKDSMPIYDINYEIKLKNVFRIVHEYENLYSVGRRGGYFFCQTPGAVRQGMKIANHLLYNN